MSVAIKICGLSDPEIAVEAVRGGAHYIGIMRYTKSIRYVDMEQACRLSKAVRSVGGMPVAVYVDRDAGQIQAECEEMGIDTVQLQGSVPRRTHASLPSSYRRFYVITVNAEGVVQKDPDQGIAALNGERDYVMFDNALGGSGAAYPLEGFKNPYNLPFLLAGGLTPESVSTAIQKVRPEGVDVSSGVESEPGIKDMQLITAFIKSVREAE